ncbi:MAG: phosphoribosylglycinamide formyltransferase [Francisellaceae bacterium]
MKKLVILSSGFGSNLGAMIEKLHQQHDIEIALVISDHDSQSLIRGQKAGIPTLYLPKNKGIDRAKYDEKLADVIAAFNPDLIVLSGFMRILTAGFIERFKGKIINIHPSLLPKYKGLNTHQRAIDAKDLQHGTTVHFVDETLDGGRIIDQRAISIDINDDKESLEKKIKTIEHDFYPEVILRLCEIEK